MCPAPDDEFKLRFPVAKDRTLRRISIIQIILSISIPVSFLISGVAAQFSRPHDPRWPDIYGDIDPSSPYYLIAILAVLTLFLAIILLIITNIIESTVLTRRYGWRAVSDPIEAQRIAMREALYDVATGSTHGAPDDDGGRIIVVPTRRLRPAGGRLKLTAEREKAQAPREA